MRSPILLGASIAAGVALAASLLLPSAAEGQHPRGDVLDFSNLRKGMKGYGLTVFEGETPERFDVEVIDVLRNFRPRQDLLLVKTIHPRLDATKIVAGMSGSPIYFEGKMVGAYAYGWSFGVEPVAGVTPIRSMLEDMDRPLPPVLRGLPLGNKSSERRPAATQAATEPTSYDPERLRGELARAMGGDREDWKPVSTPLLVSGLTPNALDALSDLVSPLGLAPLAAGGSSVRPGAAPATRGYVDGGAIGVDLIRGDMSAMGLGTVTRVEGGKLVAFGHPMMSLGVTSLPTSRARVLWFMASQQRSFKMGEGLEPRGALVNDRMSSIVVDQNATAPTIPVRLEIEGEPGAPHTRWSFEIAHDEFLSPSFLAVALGSGLEAAAQERRDLTWSMESKLVLAGYPPISLRDFGSSPSGTPQTGELVQTSLVQALGAVFGNPWSYVRVERVDVKMSLRFAREVSRLRGVEVVTPTVDVGQSAKVRVWLEPFVGPRESLLVSIPITREMAGRKMRFSFEPGYAVRRPRPAPENLSELVANLSDGMLEPRSIVVSYPKSEGAGAFAGVIAQSLPPSALDRLTTTQTTVAPHLFQSYERSIHKTQSFVVGSESVEIDVRPTLR